MTRCVEMDKSPESSSQTLVVANSFRAVRRHRAAAVPGVAGSPCHADPRLVAHRADRRRIDGRCVLRTSPACRLPGLRDALPLRSGASPCPASRGVPQLRMSRQPRGHEAGSFPPGQRVCIDRWARLVHGLDTWQAVAFRGPSDAEQLTVKRIVASGPGRVVIHDGDVYLNGHIQQKNLANSAHLRILVHDDNYRSPLANRWQSAQSTSRWKPTPRDMGRPPFPAPTQSIDWLDYVQWTCWPQQFAGSQPHRARAHFRPRPLQPQPVPRKSASRSGHPCLVRRCNSTAGDRASCGSRAEPDDFAWEFTPAEQACQLKWNGTPRRPGRVRRSRVTVGNRDGGVRSPGARRD